MSSLSKLVAITVGDFDTLTNTGGKNDTVIKVHVPIGSKQAGEYALSLSAEGITFFERLFETPYALPKLDLVAIPEFPSGAMENWGLMLFQPHKLLISQHEVNDLTRRRTVADCILHESAHQWLGNLVTPASWKDLWLKESLAVWMATHAMDHLMPLLDSWAHFVGDSMQQALDVDSLRSTHPVAPNSVAKLGETAEAATQNFDAISYRKGACLLRMIEGKIGHESFISGIKRYVRDYSFSNACTDDFWRSFETGEHSDLHQSMLTWMRLPGFPIVRYSVQPGHDSQGLCKLRLQQSRYLVHGRALNEEDYAPYALELSLKSDWGQEQVTFNTSEAVLNIRRAQTLDINYLFRGFCRVAYTEEQLGALQLDSMSNMGKVGLLMEVKALCESGDLGTSALMDTIENMSCFQESVVWEYLLQCLADFYLSWVLQDANLTDSFRLFTEHVLLKRWQLLDSTPNGDHTIIHQKKLLSKVWALSRYEKPASSDRASVAHSGQTSLIQHTKHLFVQIVSDDELDRVSKRLTESDVEGDRLLLLESLGYVRKLEHIRQVLHFLRQYNIKAQEVCSSCLLNLGNLLIQEDCRAFAWSDVLPNGGARDGCVDEIELALVDRFLTTESTTTIDTSGLSEHFDQFCIRNAQKSFQKRGARWRWPDIGPSRGKSPGPDPLDSKRPGNCRRLAGQKGVLPASSFLIHVSYQ